MTFGDRLKLIRKENRMTQQAFASEFGISQAHISKLEKGTEKPSDTLLKFISYRFAVNVEWLKTGAGDKSILGSEYTPENAIGLYHLTRQRYEHMFAELNNSQIWNYVESFDGFVNCMLLARNATALTGDPDFPYARDRFLFSIRNIQMVLSSLATVFYSKEESPNINETYNEKKMYSLNYKRELENQINKLIEDGLTFLELQQ